MTTRKIFVLMCIIVALLVVQITKQRQQINELKSQISDTELQQQIRLLINDLRIPSEALYNDPMLSRQIYEIRRQAYEKRQIKEFLPYKNVFGRSKRYVFRASSSNVLGEGASIWHGKSIYFPAVDIDWTTINSGSYENFWINRTFEAMNHLRGILDDNIRLGKYYNEHPDEFDKVVKPWVLRITRTTYSNTSMMACEILLKKGYRDKEIIEAVRQVIEHSPSKHFPSGSIEEAMHLNDQYNLGIDVPADGETKGEN